MKTLRAYLDGPDFVRVYLLNTYYEGVCNNFYLKDEKGHLEKLSIIEKHSGEEETSYKLSIPAYTYGKPYYIVDEHHLVVPLQVRHVVKSPEFDALFYTEQALGAFYEPGQTRFSLWAPTALGVKIELHQSGKKVTHELERKDKGVYTVTLAGDFEGASYHYLVRHQDQWHIASDPYAMASLANHGDSIVVDVSKVIRPRDSHPFASSSPVDAILYELHVRDYTVDPAIQNPHPGKFLGLMAQGLTSPGGNPAGFDYLVSLGVTHLQLLPMYDFGSVDEKHPFTFYNWGYDPVQYNVPEGSYVTDPDDPYKRIKELQDLVSAFHQKDMGVIMDVVYNHMFDQATSAFEKIVPAYFFRVNEDLSPSNGSFCGNDIATERPMVRRFILDSIKHWMTLYHMDGFRFDLMGLLDLKTMAAIRDLAVSLNPHVLLYGEGWDMPTALKAEAKATISNQDKLPGIGHFNDLYRDTIKGGTLLEEVEQVGFGAGHEIETDLLASLLLGSVAGKGSLFSEPEKSINYVACHDNHTLYDKLTLALPKLSPQERKRRALFINCLVLISQGVPFLHGGQEFFRSKEGDHNSYMSPDSINQIHWHSIDNHKDAIDTLRRLIALRKSNRSLRLRSKEEVKEFANFKGHREGHYELKLHHPQGVPLTILIQGEGTNKPLTVEKDLLFSLASEKDQLETFDLKIYQG